MKMTLRTINIILFIFCFNPLFGQTNVLIPNKGIEGISIVIDSSKISDVFKIYGTDYKISERKLTKDYRYEEIGLIFSINPYDKNQIVRSISIQAPFQAQTKNGIVLNESTMKDVWDTYDRGCFTSKYYAWNSQDGISFYIRKEPNKEGYDIDEKIYKIEINNDGDFRSPSRVNFEFNEEPIDNKIKELISILNSDNLNFEQLNSFWEKEKTTEKKYYGLEKRTNFKRNLNNGLTQESIELRMVGTFYDLNIIKKNNDLAYLKLIDNKEQKTVIERREIPETENIDFDIFVYGTFCGVGGTPPDKCQEMLSLVGENNYEQLSNWLKSDNPEIATYGYIGIDFLNQKRMDILPTEAEKMEQLRKSEIQLNTCQGCYFGVTEKISDVLTKKNLKQIYRSFEQSGWLE